MSLLGLNLQKKNNNISSITIEQQNKTYLFCFEAFRPQASAIWVVVVEQCSTCVLCVGVYSSGKMVPLCCWEHKHDQIVQALSHRYISTYEMVDFPLGFPASPINTSGYIVLIVFISVYKVC
jgi:hypothetical protein